MQNIRPAAVSGLFYPANGPALNTMVVNELRSVKSHSNSRFPKAIIVPHAGYIYSGAIAASAYSRLQPYRQHIKRVIIIGPSHRVGFNGLALSSADYFETPLGNIPVDKETNEQLLAIDGVKTLDQAHVQEHSIEVQLPFLQNVLDDFTIVPIVAGNASAKLVDKVINSLWSNDNTVIVISSDLSHYHDYVSAQQLDLSTSDAILNLDLNQIDSEHACGCVGIRGLLSFAQHHAVEATSLDIRNSGDTAGDKDSVVGYGAFIFSEVI